MAASTRIGDGIALLFTPPFDKTSHDPGYIKGYPPGLGENGGQYSHAAMWAILAYVKLGDGERVDCDREGVPLDAQSHTLSLNLSVLAAALSES